VKLLLLPAVAGEVVLLPEGCVPHLLLLLLPPLATLLMKDHSVLLLLLLVHEPLLVSQPLLLGVQPCLAPEPPGVSHVVTHDSQTQQASSCSSPQSVRLVKPLTHNVICRVMIERTSLVMPEINVITK
jgi:hypothetical protein